MGPAPTLPVKAPVDALFGHRQHPRGPSHHLPVDARRVPRSADSLSGILFVYGRFGIEQLIKSLDAAGYDRVT